MIVGPKWLSSEIFERKKSAEIARNLSTWKTLRIFGGVFKRKLRYFIFSEMVYLVCFASNLLFSVAVAIFLNVNQILFSILYFGVWILNFQRIFVVFVGRRPLPFELNRWFVSIWWIYHPLSGSNSWFHFQLHAIFRQFLNFRVISVKKRKGYINFESQKRKQSSFSFFDCAHHRLVNVVIAFGRSPQIFQLVYGCFNGNWLKIDPVFSSCN